MPTSSTNPHLPFGENKNAEWYGKDIISVKQFGRNDLEYVFGVAHAMRGMVERVGPFLRKSGRLDQRFQFSCARVALYGFPGG